MTKMLDSVKNSFTEAAETIEEEVKEEPVEQPKETSKKAGKKKKPSKQNQDKQSAPSSKVPFILAIILIGIITHSTFTYVCHSVHVASEAYSSPSVVLAGRWPDGSKQIIDDFRESYDWLW